MSVTPIHNSKITPVKQRGGKRTGAGRRVGTGKFGEATSVIRVPTSQQPVIQDFLSAYQKKRKHHDLDAVAEFVYPSLNPQSLALPLFSSKVAAGVPSPADDHVEKRLDPNDFLIDHKESTFFVTIQGNSMIDAGLLPGDKAVVDRSKIASVGDIVLAMLDGEFTIKTLSRGKQGQVKLLPANSSGDYAPIHITEEMYFEVWGVVIGSFRRY